MQQAQVKYRRLNLTMLLTQRRSNLQNLPDWLRQTRPTLAGYDSAISMSGCESMIPWGHVVCSWLCSIVSLKIMSRLNLCLLKLTGSFWFWDLVNDVCCAGEAVCVLGVHEGYRLAAVHLQCLSVLLSSSVLSGLKLLAQSLDRWPCCQQHPAQQKDALRGLWSPGTLTRWF